MTMPTPQLAIDQLRRLIDESDEPLLKIAREAGVSYQPLYKWATRRQRYYNLLDGELVYFYLTGKTFMPNLKPTK